MGRATPTHTQVSMNEREREREEVIPAIKRVTVGKVSLKVCVCVCGEEGISAIYVPGNYAIVSRVQVPPPSFPNSPSFVFSLSSVRLCVVANSVLSLFHTHTHMTSVRSRQISVQQAASPRWSPATQLQVPTTLLPRLQESSASMAYSDFAISDANDDASNASFSLGGSPVPPPVRGPLAHSVFRFGIASESPARRPHQAVPYTTFPPSDEDDEFVIDLPRAAPITSVLGKPPKPTSAATSLSCMPPSAGAPSPPKSKGFLPVVVLSPASSRAQPPTPTSASTGSDYRAAANTTLDDVSSAAATLSSVRLPRLSSTGGSYDLASASDAGRSARSEELHVQQPSPKRGTARKTRTTWW